MKFVNLFVFVLISFFTVGCASTSNPYLVKVEKRALISDHHLMMSLLNRPITKDQQIMLAFADQQAQYQSNTRFVNAVAIVGEKPSALSNIRPSNSYTTLITNDLNAIRLNGPK